MLSDAVIIAVVISAIWVFIFRLRRGAFPPSFGKLDLRAPGVFILAFAIQFSLVILGVRRVSFIGAIFPYAYIFSFLVLLFALFQNRHLLGMKIAAIGIALNFLVISANLGHMPADANLARRTGKTYLLNSPYFPRSRPITPQTRLPFLGDIFVLDKPYPLPQIFSLGDIFVTLGACLLTFSIMGVLPEKRIAK